MAVDLRSDTLTMPGPGMLEAMGKAELGDDVWGEDPTVNRLQEVSAERLGKEAALFVSSGTMGNLLGIVVNARSSQEVIADADSHTCLSEVGGAAALAGVQIMPVRTEAGVMSPAQVAAAIRVEDVHHPRTAAVFPVRGLVGRQYLSPVRRIDQAYGDRNLVCSCPPPEAFAEHDFATESVPAASGGNPGSADGAPDELGTTSDVVAARA